jgi:acyl-CoA reductase-like NAD-dependent aldehyde dehydrogenase
VQPSPLSTSSFLALPDIQHRLAASSQQLAARVTALRRRYQALIREHQEELAAIITREQGKTLADARGDVFRFAPGSRRHQKFFRWFWVVDMRAAGA